MLSFTESLLFLIVSVIMICQTKKFSELDQQNKNQEDKFLNYIQGMSFSTFRICFLLFLSLVAMNAWGSNCRSHFVVIFSFAVAEEYMQHVKNENEQLHSQLNDLRSEVASLRHAILSSSGIPISQV